MDPRVFRNSTYFFIIPYLFLHYPMPNLHIISRLTTEALAPSRVLRGYLSRPRVNEGATRSFPSHLNKLCEVIAFQLTLVSRYFLHRPLAVKLQLDRSNNNTAYIPPSHPGRHSILN